MSGGQFWGRRPERDTDMRVPYDPIGRTYDVPSAERQAYQHIIGRERVIESDRLDERHNRAEGLQLYDNDMRQRVDDPRTIVAQPRLDDSTLRITVDNDQYHTQQATSSFAKGYSDPVSQQLGILRRRADEYGSETVPPGRTYAPGNSASSFAATSKSELLAGYRPPDGSSFASAPTAYRATSGYTTFAAPLRSEPLAGYKPPSSGNYTATTGYKAPDSSMYTTSEHRDPLAGYRSGITPQQSGTFYAGKSSAGIQPDWKPSDERKEALSVSGSVSQNTYLQKTADILSRLESFKKLTGNLQNITVKPSAGSMPHPAGKPRIDISVSAQETLLKNLSMIVETFGPASASGVKPTDAPSSSRSSLVNPSTATMTTGSYFRQCAPPAGGQRPLGLSLNSGDVSAKPEDRSSKDKMFSLKYRSVPSTATAVTTTMTMADSGTPSDAVFASVLKSIGFNFDVSQFKADQSPLPMAVSNPVAAALSSPALVQPPVCASTSSTKGASGELPGIRPVYFVPVDKLDSTHYAAGETQFNAGQRSREMTKTSKQSEKPPRSNPVRQSNSSARRKSRSPPGARYRPSSPSRSPVRERPSHKGVQLRDVKTRRSPVVEQRLKKLQDRSKHRNTHSPRKKRVSSRSPKRDRPTRKHARSPSSSLSSSSSSSHRKRRSSAHTPRSPFSAQFAVLPGQSCPPGPVGPPVPLNFCPPSVPLGYYPPPPFVFPGTHVPPPVQVAPLVTPNYSTRPPPFVPLRSKKDEEVDWRRSTEEFLRRMNEPSRTAVAPTDLLDEKVVERAHSPGADSDFSSISSGSIPSVPGGVGDYDGETRAFSIADKQSRIADLVLKMQELKNGKTRVERKKFKQTEREITRLRKAIEASIAASCESESTSADAVCSTLPAPDAGSKNIESTMAGNKILESTEDDCFVVESFVTNEQIFKPNGDDQSKKTAVANCEKSPSAVASVEETEMKPSSEIVMTGPNYSSVDVNETAEKCNKLATERLILPAAGGTVSDASKDENQKSKKDLTDKQMKGTTEKSLLISKDDSVGKLNQMDTRKAEKRSHSALSNKTDGRKKDDSAADSGKRVDRSTSRASREPSQQQGKEEVQRYRVDKERRSKDRHIQDRTKTGDSRRSSRERDKKDREKHAQNRADKEDSRRKSVERDRRGHEGARKRDGRGYSREKDDKRKDDSFDRSRSTKHRNQSRSQSRGRVDLVGYKDVGQHWCTTCLHDYDSIASYLVHLELNDHKQQVSAVKVKPETTKPVDVSKCRRIEGVGGAEFVMTVSEPLYCKLCHLFLDDHSHATSHLLSTEHNWQYKSYIEKNKSYLHDLLKMKSKTSAHSVDGKQSAVKRPIQTKNDGADNNKKSRKSLDSPKRVGLAKDKGNEKLSPHAEKDAKTTSDAVKSNTDAAKPVVPSPKASPNVVIVDSKVELVVAKKIKGPSKKIKNVLSGHANDMSDISSTDSDISDGSNVADTQTPVTSFAGIFECSNKDVKTDAEAAVMDILDTVIRNVVAPDDLESNNEDTVDYSLNTFEIDSTAAAAVEAYSSGTVVDDGANANQEEMAVDDESLISVWEVCRLILYDLVSHIGNEMEPSSEFLVTDDVDQIESNAVVVDHNEVLLEEAQQSDDYRCQDPANEMHELLMTDDVGPVESSVAVVDHGEVLLEETQQSDDHRCQDPVIEMHELLMTDDVGPIESNVAVVDHGEVLQEETQESDDNRSQDPAIEMHEHLDASAQVMGDDDWNEEQQKVNDECDGERYADVYCQEMLCYNDGEQQMSTDQLEHITCLNDDNIEELNSPVQAAADNENDDEGEHVAAVEVAMGVVSCENDGMIEAEYQSSYDQPVDENVFDESNVGSGEGLDEVMSSDNPPPGCNEDVTESCEAVDLSTSYSDCHFTEMLPALVESEHSVDSVDTNVASQLVAAVDASSEQHVELADHTPFEVVEEKEDIPCGFVAEPEQLLSGFQDAELLLQGIECDQPQQYHPPADLSDLNGAQPMYYGEEEKYSAELGFSDIIDPQHVLSNVSEMLEADELLPTEVNTDSIESNCAAVDSETNLGTCEDDEDFEIDLL